jgi:hypothetical protein
MIRSALIVALALAAAAPLSAQRKVAERFPAAADAHISILNIAGSVKVTGWEHDSVAVTGVVNELPAQKFTIQRSDAGVKIGIWDPNVEKVAPSDFEVRVPAGAQVWVRTGSAGVYVGGVRGGIDVNSVGGMIEIRGAPREAFAESMTGGIVLDVNSPMARARTVTAGVRVHGRITDLTATSVSGNILLDGAVIERGSLETVDGELRFVGSFTPRAALAFVTHGGAVEFLLPAATNATFRVGSYEGGLVNEFTVPVRTTRSKIKGAHNTFTLGRGGAEIDVRTFRGRVVVRSR